VSLVGYTNAGKSTLFNALTRAGTYAADQLFATLDTTSRRAFIAPDVEIVVSDTVGFIRGLPHSLVEAFKSTLEETREADLLLHVIDGASPARDAQIAQFRAGPPNSVFLIQIKAGGVGLNLQEATRVYITCPAWNPATELQAIGRAHRTGQTQKVVVRRLIYTGEDGVEPLPSVEQSIMQLQEGKAKVCAEILNDPRLESQVPNVTRTKITIHALRKIFAV
jgi:tRNA U34 5-carboxymethylaminomethyl modifying GTPase MnmE/TrmE